MERLPVIPGYQVVKRLGQGRITNVFQALNSKTGQPLVIKTLLPELAPAENDVFADHFLDEARRMSKLVHPNIAKIIDIDETELYYYYVMEYFEESLRDRIIRTQLAVDLDLGGIGGEEEDESGFTPHDVLNIMRQLAGALEWAHKHGIVHRDIRPSNVFFRTDGSIALADFNIPPLVALSEPLRKKGVTVTPAQYTCPETALRQPPGVTNDFYSLGIILYEMLVGQVPYDAEDRLELENMHVMSPVPKLPPDSARFQPMLDALMAKKKESRIQDCGELLFIINELAAELQGGQAPAAGSPPMGQVPQSAQPMPTAAPPFAPPPQTTPPPPPMGPEETEQYELESMMAQVELQFEEPFEHEEPDTREIPLSATPAPHVPPQPASPPIEPPPLQAQPPAAQPSPPPQPQGRGVKNKPTPLVSDAPPQMFFPDDPPQIGSGKLGKPLSRQMGAQQQTGKVQPEDEDDEMVLADPMDIPLEDEPEPDYDMEESSVPKKEWQDPGKRSFMKEDSGGDGFPAKVIEWVKDNIREPKVLMALGGVVIIIVAALFFLWPSGDDDAEKTADNGQQQEAGKNGQPGPPTPQMLARYKMKLDLAKKRIAAGDITKAKQLLEDAGKITTTEELTKLKAQLEKEGGEQKDHDAYKKAEEANTTEAFAQYLTDFPSGLHAEEAKQKQDALTELEKQRQAMEEKWARLRIKLRTTGQVLTILQVREMVTARNFFEKYYNPGGEFKNALELQTIATVPVVLDRATGLLWLQSGSATYLSMAEAEKWVAQLNAENHAGFSDWRIPTLEEAISLLESQESKYNMYIDAVFSRDLQNTLTVDRFEADQMWIVSYYSGDITRFTRETKLYVLPVRTHSK